MNLIKLSRVDVINRHRELGEYLAYFKSKKRIPIEWVGVIFGEGAFREIDDSPALVTLVMPKQKQIGLWGDYPALTWRELS